LHERINPYLTAPWRQTSTSFGSQVHINLCKPEMKDDEEKCKLIDNHKERVCKLLDRNNHLIIYSDGSMIKKRGFPQVRATVVSYHNGEEVFLETMGMGGLRCTTWKWQAL